MFALLVSMSVFGVVMTDKGNDKMLKLIDTLDIKTLKNIQKSLNDLLLILEGKSK